MIDAPFPEFDLSRPCIGLMADSHGCLAAITYGLSFLKDAGAETIIHLGDIFDSLHNDPLDHIYETVRRHGVLGVKGNNDHQVETLLAAGASLGLSPPEKEAVSAFLRDLPLRRGDQTVCFAHSHPFDGIRSFYEPIDTGGTEQAAMLFARMRYQILFCGHSHTSVLFRWRRGHVTREPIDPDVVLRFQPRERYILIVGAANKGEYGIFHRTEMTYRRMIANFPG
jgi:predicted phosphodiesterase